MPHIQRLIQMAELLEQPLPPDHTFDLGLYYHQGSCGTVCCALGLAAQTAIFQAQGFTTTPGYEIPRFGIHFGLDAAATFFELTHDTAVGLFWRRGYKMPASQITPQIVAKKIRQLIAQSSTPTESLS